MSVIGNFFALYMNDQRVALVQSSGVGVKTDTVDKTNYDSNGHTEVHPVNNSLSANVDGIYCSAIGNLLQWPERFDKPGWTLDGSVDSTFLPGPTGQLHAQEVTISAAGGYIEQTVSTPSGSNKHTVSVWAKGTGNLDLIIEHSLGTTGTKTIALTSTLTRYDISLPTAVSGGTLTWRLQNNDLIDIPVVLFGAMLNVGDKANDYIGSEKLIADLQAAQLAGTALQMRYSTDISGDFQIAGDAYITNMEHKGKVKDLVMFSCTLTGDGVQALTSV